MIEPAIEHLEYLTVSLIPRLVYISVQTLLKWLIRVEATRDEQDMEPERECDGEPSQIYVRQYRHSTIFFMTRASVDHKILKLDQL